VINFIEVVRERCHRLRGRLGFPDVSDPRVLLASSQLLSEDAVSEITLYMPQDEALTMARGLNLDLERFRDRLVFVNLPSPEERLAHAAAQVRSGELDAVLAGNLSTTASVIRAGLTHLGLAPGVRTVSGSFFMHRPMGPTYLFADCGVVIAPTVEQLVDIASESVRTWSLLVPSVPPSLAFLSFSTHGSARHESQGRMAEAAALFRARCPHVTSDGELQFDAAIDPDIARRKAPGSPVAGSAQCFIFPSLDAGNIAYKVTQRLGGFEAYGPILQGLRGAYSDLSRGATVADIITSAYINLVRGMEGPRESEAQK
jgi:phosphate acetyltransferase